MGVTTDVDLGQEHPNQNGVGAFASELFQQHSQMVLGVCRLLLLDPVEAEDAMQQVFLSAYRSILAGSEPRQPAAWLATIARNECLDRIRARMREPLAGPRCNDDSEAPDTLAAVIANADLRALGRSIGELPTQQREALLLQEFCGLSYRQVAAALGVSESAIGSLLFRARQSLRSALQGVYAFLPLPALRDTLAHLLARGPAVKLATLPVVAKLATGSVAVGLLAGGAVAIERTVAAQRGPHPARFGATAPTRIRAKPVVNRTRVAKPRAPTPSARLVAPAVRDRFRTSPPAKPKPSHTVPPAPPAPANAASDELPPKVSPPPASQAGKPSLPRRQRSSSASAQGRSEHDSTGNGNGKAERQHGHWRSSGKPSSPGNAGAANGNGNPGSGGEGNGNNPNTDRPGTGNAGGSSGSAPPGNGVGSAAGDTRNAVDHKNAGPPPVHPGH